MPRQSRKPVRSTRSFGRPSRSLSRNAAALAAWSRRKPRSRPSSRSMTAYRICDDKNGQPMTLFHGIRGSRRIPLDQWVEADVKIVHDGDRGRPYRSGFHVLKEKGTAKRVFVDTFKKLKGRAIVKVQVAMTWPKKHSKHGVTLARHMKISSNDWAKRSRGDHVAKNRR